MPWPKPTIAWFSAPAAFLSWSMFFFSSLETRSNFSRIVFLSSSHRDRLVEEPDDGDLVVLEVAEDLAGELVHRDADLLDVEDRVAGDLAAAAEVGAGAMGSRFRGERARPSILTPGRLLPSLICPLPAPRTRGVAVGRPTPMPPATITPPPSSPPSPPPSSSTIIAGSRASSACSSPMALSRGWLSGSA